MAWADKFAGVAGLIIVCLLVLINNSTRDTTDAELRALVDAQEKTIISMESALSAAVDAARVTPAAPAVVATAVTPTATECECPLANGTGGVVPTAAEMGGGSASEMMSIANNGKGFAMLQEPGLRSLVIEIGLHDVVMDPRGDKQHVIGIEASLRSMCEPWATPGVSLKKPRLTLLAAAMGSRVGVTDWFERDGWTAANSMSKQDSLVAYAGPTKAVTSVTVAPVITLATILSNVPSTLPLAFLKIDAQAHNYYIIVGAQEHINRAEVIFSECTIDMASDGKTGASVYGDENDNCSNIRKYLEGKGFVWMGGETDASTDKTGDQYFCRPQHVEKLKHCVRKWQEWSMPKASEESCLHQTISPIVEADGYVHVQ